MKINVDRDKLRRALDAMVAEGDAEKLPTEYAADFFDAQPPVSMEIEFGKKGCEVLSCYQLLFSEELDGWYTGEKITDEALIARVLNSLTETAE